MSVKGIRLLQQVRQIGPLAAQRRPRSCCGCLLRLCLIIKVSADGRDVSHRNGVKVSSSMKKMQPGRQVGGGRAGSGRGGQEAHRSLLPRSTAAFGALLALATPLPPPRPLRWRCVSLHFDLAASFSLKSI